MEDSESWKPLRPWGLTLFEFSSANYAAGEGFKKWETAQAMGIDTF
jgi:hypothetical protein